MRVGRLLEGRRENLVRRMSVPDAAALAKAKDKGLFESHIEEKSVSVSLAVPIHEILCSL